MVNYMLFLLNSGISMAMVLLGSWLIFRTVYELLNN